MSFGKPGQRLKHSRHELQTSYCRRNSLSNDCSSQYSDLSQSTAADQRSPWSSIKMGSGRWVVGSGQWGSIIYPFPTAHCPPPTAHSLCSIFAEGFDFADRIKSLLEPARMGFLGARECFKPLGDFIKSFFAGGAGKARIHFGVLIVSPAIPAFRFNSVPPIGYPLARCPT